MQLKRIFDACGTAFLLMTFASQPASADKWNYGSRAGLNSDWNDNPALLNDNIDPQSTFRFLASYDGALERNDRNTTFSIKPRITRDYYPDRQFSNLETTDYFLPGSYAYRRPVTSWILSYNASRQSVLSNEETISQGAPAGTLQGDDTLTQLSLAPSVSWQVTEKDLLRLGANYGTNDYGLEFTGRSDTTSTGANFSYRRTLTERQAVGVSGVISSSNSDRRSRAIPVEINPPTDPPTFVFLEGEIKTDSTSSYFTADYNYAVSQTSTLQISYGIQDSTTETKAEINSTGQSRTFGSFNFNSTTYNVSYASEGPRGDYTISASRDVTLDITNGQPQDRYQIQLGGRYKLTNRLTGSMRLLAWEQQAVALEALDENDSPVNISKKVTYASGEIRFDWNLTKKWYLNSRYEYRWRKTDQSFDNFNQNLTAVSNQLSIGISYVWKDIPR
jgi:hypothetical protein